MGTEERIYRYEPLWGSWRVDKHIGSGAFGSVYKIYRKDFEKTHYAAVKVISIPQSESEIKSLRSEGMSDQDIKKYYYSFVKNLIQEVELMEELKGVTNIVNIEDYQVHQKEDGFGWDILFRMEFLTGIYDYIGTRYLNEQEVTKLGLDICKALDYCDKIHIIHRDVKPENIFVNRFGEFKLGDFGIARELDKNLSGLSVKGTVTYMAPELYKGRDYDKTVDIYALGITLYRLLNNNRAPFLPPHPQMITPTVKELATIERMNGTEIPKPVRGSDALQRIILKACSYDPADRYQSAAEMLYELEGISAGRGRMYHGAEPEVSKWNKTVSVSASLTERSGYPGKTGLEAERSASRSASVRKESAEESRQKVRSFWQMGADL